MRQPRAAPTRTLVIRSRVERDASFPSNSYIRYTPYDYYFTSPPSTTLPRSRPIIDDMARGAREPRQRGPDGRFAPRRDPSPTPMQLQTPVTPPRLVSVDSDDDSSDSGSSTPKFPLRRVTAPVTPPGSRRSTENPTTSPPLNRNPKPGLSPGHISQPLPTVAPSLGSALASFSFASSLSPSPVLVSPSANPLPGHVSQVVKRTGTALVTPAIESSSLPVTQPSSPLDAAVLASLPPSPLLSPDASPSLAPTTLPTMTSSSHEDLRAARTQLAKLDDFDDEGKPMREAEWRHRFNVATRGIDDANRAQLWADKLVYEGEAYEWLQTVAHSVDQNMKDAAKDWAKLLPLIEKRWPTPKRDPEAVIDTQKRKWFDSKMEVAKLAEQYKAGDNLTKPHAQWVLQHRAKGRACGSADTDLVYQTLHHALPGWVILLLPKQDKYRSDFDELCDDIGNISSRVLFESYAREVQFAELLASTRNMSLAAPMSSALPAMQPRINRRQAPAPAAPIAPQTARPPQVTFGSTTSVPPRQPATRDTPPHLPLGSQPAQPSQSADSRFPSRLPRKLPPLVAEPTPAEFARHKGLVDEFKAKFQDSQPSVKRPYPLTPGTRQQDRDLCTKCGKAYHWRRDCLDSSQWLPEDEQDMRRALRRALKEPVDTNQLEAVEDAFTDYYSENEEGQ